MGVSVVGMTIAIDEHRTHFRLDQNNYTVEVTRRHDDYIDGDRVTVQVSGSDPEGRVVTDASIEVAARELERVIGLLGDELRSAAGLPTRGRRRLASPPPNQGRPWTADDDRELERRWIAGQDMEAIAAHFGRTVGAIERRLPMAGCDPYSPGAYLPPPPSQRDDEEAA